MPSFLMQRKKQIMKSLRKPVYVIAIILTAVLFSACSQNVYHKRNIRHASASHIDPVSPKKYPLRKNYIVPVKRKVILGQQKPKI